MTNSTPGLDVELQQQLLFRIGQSDSRALSELYDLLSKPIAAIAYRILSDKHEVEEVLQDVFVAIWNHAINYDPSISRPFSWIVVITKRLCWNRIRSQKRHDRKVQALEEAGAGPVIPEIERSAPELTEQLEISEKIKEGLDDFPDNQKRILELALFKGMTHEEIAEQENIPLGTVKTWIRRGIIKIRNKMEANL